MLWFLLPCLVSQNVVSFFFIFKEVFPPTSGFVTKDSKMVLTESKLNFNAEFVKVSMVLFKGSNGESFINFTLSQNVDVLKQV